MSWNRRSWLAASVFGLSMRGQDSLAKSSQRLIYRQREPDNLESDFSAMESFLTPNKAFYVRSHFPVPPWNPASWSLQVDGAVKQTQKIGWEAFQNLPKTKVIATLECAGNSRVFLSPAAAGVQWELGAVGTAEWSGVRLKDVLQAAGVAETAVEVLLEGADGGAVRNEPKPEGRIAFARSIPLSKAMTEDVLLATHMNGQPLAASHGAPVRAVVPGYYGMSSIKWLQRISVLTEPFGGYFQTVDYGIWKNVNGHPVRKPLWEMTVKSAISRPSVGDTLAAGKSANLQGWAWTGDAEITKVEVSVDGGKTWSETNLADQKQKFAWRQWQFNWEVPNMSGKYVLMSRATDSKGNVQPAAHDPLTGNYVIHHTLPINVYVL
jgi:DMSO/TMAO reductase YedYZ molybdopterin-dependent catalytic subunit